MESKSQTAHFFLTKILFHNNKAHKFKKSAFWGINIYVHLLNTWVRLVCLAQVLLWTLILSNVLLLCATVSLVTVLQPMKLSCLCYCLPMLTYAMPAINLKSKQLPELKACWNSVFRKIFGFNKSVFLRLFIHGMGRFDLIRVLLVYHLKFYRYLCSSKFSLSILALLV
jgi:hypothetical protein